MPDEFALHLGHIVESSILHLDHTVESSIHVRVEIVKPLVKPVQSTDYHGHIPLDVNQPVLHTVKPLLNPTEPLLNAVQPLLNALYLFVEFLDARLECIREPAADRFDALANCLHRLIHSAIL